ncbi:MAG: hypothetical protein ISS15_13905 [Alphaproteobacteria bacterium]|nr:hypothetical protein [Alphaproteobacteria bacterium]MBL6936201.1 hypothetical protein [Alphaproteobacteria bacterium]MBL7098748.1 hypothetical protein [Alphaproteobacteria bacterium]
MREIVITRQFRGPPNSGNGGYVCGVLAREIPGASTVALRALIPLDTALRFEETPEGARLVGQDGTLIADGVRATTALPDPPPPPTLEQARAAGERCKFIEKPFHPPCFTCSSIREEGDGLRILPGQIEGAEPGHIACVWVPHANFAATDGTISAEIIWAALDCPGSLAWITKAGMGGGLLGTMTGELLHLPRAGQSTIVTAWPIEQSGRKFTAGVALFDAQGKLMARGSQIWISRGGPPRPA